MEFVGLMITGKRDIEKDSVRLPVPTWALIRAISRKSVAS